ncbi:MAG TPA: hypothetical protein VLC92_03475 [Rhodocyclaceae bacterium]|nr:hypothetical protein [Rhodocyclaceae bacterium]
MKSGNAAPNELTWHLLTAEVAQLKLDGALLTGEAVPAEKSGVTSSGEQVAR